MNELFDQLFFKGLFVWDVFCSQLTIIGRKAIDTPSMMENELIDSYITSNNYWPVKSRVNWPYTSY